MKWQGETILKQVKEIAGSVSTYLILVFIFLLWRFVLGIHFEWQQIEPFEQPSIFVRSFYSAFTFFTLGFLLYVARFYKVLHDIVVKAFDMWGLYNFIKAVLWLFLMYISYAYLVPWLFNILNGVLSILFNIANLMLYVLPPVGISIILSVIYFLGREKFISK